MSGRNDAAGTLAIVLIDHGSRRPEANAQLEELARRVAARRPDALVRTAHLELAEPNLPHAIDECVAAGARTVVVHPFFLGPGRHTTEDIPRQTAEARRRHPGVAIETTAPLGVGEGMVDIVLTRIEETDPGDPPKAGSGREAGR